MPVGMPFEPYNKNHVMAMRYISRVLVDDVAGEDLPEGLDCQDVVYVSDLPEPARVVRPGMLWPQGLLLPNETLVLVVDQYSIIKYVGCLDDRMLR
ncbi:hypothetical protein FBU59_007320 [Linderina macrospora]|uniref:Uncharacterized protein n=1 Tax=Linderina macrospora TaxID=4868 RepID=A0ACC1IXD0_9FUNG|nr:hypothetical protein FBU59_007320 [Linderina macrospora]